MLDIYIQMNHIYKADGAGGAVAYLQKIPDARHENSLHYKISTANSFLASIF